MLSLVRSLLVATICLATIAVSPQSTTKTTPEPVDTGYESSGDLKQRLDGGSGMMDEVIDTLNAMMPSWTELSAEMAALDSTGTTDGGTETEAEAGTGQDQPEQPPTAATTPSAAPTAAPAPDQTVTITAASPDTPFTTLTAVPTQAAHPSDAPATTPPTTTTAPSAARSAVPSAAPPTAPILTAAEKEWNDIRVAVLFTILIWGMFLMFVYYTYYAWRVQQRNRNAVTPFLARPR